MINHDRLAPVPLRHDHSLEGDDRSLGRRCCRQLRVWCVGGASHQWRRLGETDCGVYRTLCALAGTAVSIDAVAGALVRAEVTATGRQTTP
jgi:hypothetical protein